MADGAARQGEDVSVRRAGNLAGAVDCCGCGDGLGLWLVMG